MIKILRQLFATSLAIALIAPSAAQLQRQFPQAALRGQISFRQPPLLTLNDEPKQLAPGARIRAANNMIVLSGSLLGSTLAVHYTLDADGQLRDVWILRADELANVPWPSNALEAASWVFDSAAQRWARR
jgi:hypothetical protein